MKIKKNNLLLVGKLLMLAIFLPQNSKALDLGAIIGTAKTIGDIVVGQTVVTPAYALNSWTYREWGNYTDYFGEDVAFSRRSSVKRDPVTQTFFIK